MRAFYFENKPDSVALGIRLMRRGFYVVTGRQPFMGGVVYSVHAALVDTPSGG